MKKFQTIILAFGLTLSAFAADVPGISVEYVSVGTQAYVQALSSIGRIEFKNSHAFLIFKDTSADSHDLGALSSVKRIMFGPVSEDDLIQPSPTAAPVDINTLEVSVYPNPVASHLHVTGIASGTILRVFAADGKLVYVGSDADVDMSGMTCGVYFLQVGQEIVKVIKK